jgi:hypothetical protein
MPSAIQPYGTSCRASMPPPTPPRSLPPTITSLLHPSELPQRLVACRA